MSSVSITGTARGSVAARLLDLSLGGALIALPVPLRPDGVQDLQLEIGGDPFHVRAEVRHCQPIGGEYHVGVEFVDIDPRDERRLRDFIRSRS
jgi:c-di-GMP-binding flagellar brake protein YcgR